MVTMYAFDKMNPFDGETAGSSEGLCALIAAVLTAAVNPPELMLSIRSVDTILKASVGSEVLETRWVVKDS